MIDFTPEEISTYYAVRAPRLKQTRSREWRGACPVHDGKDPNFVVNAQSGQAHCHSRCGQGWDILSLEMAITGRTFPDCKRTVFRLLQRPEPSPEEADIQAAYDYTDEQGNVLYQVVRKSGKRFSQRRPRPDGWQWGLGSVQPVPYQLPLVAKAEFVAVVEGEKDAINLTRAGIVATCNNGGAGNFKSVVSPYFSGKRVMILPDNDEPGRKHALKVAKLLSSHAATVRIVELPEQAEKSDVSDFLSRGGTVEQIRELFERAADWTPDWKFQQSIPNENDRYVRTIEQCVLECGGPDGFWNLAAQDGVPTPWYRLTRRLGGGLRAGEVYVIGGNQGSGKTSLALQFGIGAMKQRRGVLMFSMEMTHRDVFQRMAAIEARVDLLTLRDLQREKRTQTFEYSDMMKALNAALSELCDLALLVTTKSAVTPEFLLKETTRLTAKQRVDLVVIDHMQLMAATGTVRGDYEKFTSISRMTKQVAMELRVPVLLVSQTSRNNTTDKRTELDVSDLRGCLDKSTLILMADGTRKRIKDIVRGDLVLGLGKDQKLRRQHVADCWSNGTRLVYKLRSRLGREIVATGNHPFRTPSGWQPLDALAPGDDIAGVLRAYVSGECDDEHADLCRLAGYMVGNGSYLPCKGISFTTPDPDVMADLKHIVKRRFPEVEIRVEEHEHHFELDLVRVLENGYGFPGCNPVRNWLYSHGMNGRYDTKRVPKFVFSKGSRGAIEFLSGYLMTDGCIKEGRSFSVCFDTTSLGLAKDVQHLLCRIGVAAVVNSGAMNTKSKVPIYRVSVVRQKANTWRLLSKLALFGKNYKKRENAESYLGNAVDENSHLLALPKEYSVAVSRQDWRSWRNTDRRIGREKALNIGIMSGNKEFEEWATSDVIWDIVETIEPYGEVETFDIRVPDICNFTANDFIVHNSGAIEEDAAAVMLIYPEKEGRDQALMAGTFSHSVVSELKLGKNRYGEQGLRLPLMHSKWCTRFDEIEAERRAAS